MTKQQTVILNLIMKAEDHLTAEQVFLLAKEELPSIAMGTVYRNLNIMAMDKRINRLEIAGEPDRFCRNIVPHDHLICDQCHEIKDIKFAGLKNYLEEKSKVNITTFDLCIHYICDECKKK